MDYKDYNVLLELNENATIFHTLEWKKVLEETFNYIPEYNCLKNAKDELVGILPAFSIRTLRGKAIISQPFFEYGGPLLASQFENSYLHIFKFYKHKIDAKEAKYIELKNLSAIESKHFESAGFIKQFKAYDFYIDVRGKDFERDIWFGLYTKKSRVRNSVRKAIDSGVRIIENRDINQYYKLYLKTVERLGSAPYPKKLFEIIEKHMGSNVRYTFAYLGKTPLAAMMSFPYKRRNLLVGLVSDDSFQEYRANDLLYNEQIEYATNQNFDIVDFGRTRPNSFYERYKKKWGASRCDMFSYICPASAKEEINPYKFYLRFSRITTKAPWLLTKTGIGSRLIKYFP